MNIYISSLTIFTILFYTKNISKLTDQIPIQIGRKIGYITNHIQSSIQKLAMEWEPTLTDPNYDPTDDLWIPICFRFLLYLLLSLFLRTISPSLSYSSSLIKFCCFSICLHSSSSFFWGEVFAFLPDFLGTLTDLHFFFEHYDPQLF